MNLATNNNYQAVAQAFVDEIAARWDLDALYHRCSPVSKTPVLTQVAGRDAIPDWDYQPFQRASTRYIRNHQTLDEQEAFARYPSPAKHRE